MSYGLVSVEQYLSLYRLCTYRTYNKQKQNQSCCGSFLIQNAIRPRKTVILVQLTLRPWLSTVNTSIPDYMMLHTKFLIMESPSFFLLFMFVQDGNVTHLLLERYFTEVYTWFMLRGCSSMLYFIMHVSCLQHVS